MRKNLSKMLIFIAMSAMLFAACPPTQPLTASFMFSPAKPIVGQLVRFYDRSAGKPTSWAWKVENSFLSVERNPSYAFVKAGNYSVSLAVENAAGTQRSTIKTITIAPALVPDFTWETFAEAETELKFTDISGGTPTSWLWNFGDGATSSLKNPAHTYAVGGTFSVTLTISNANGSKSATKPVVVEIALKVNFTWTPALPVGGQEVQFTDLSTGVGIVSWLWEFGDGGTSTLQNPKHTFVNATGVNKDFTVTLTVTNEHGVIASMTIRP